MDFLTSATLIITGTYFPNKGVLKPIFEAAALLVVVIFTTDTASLFAVDLLIAEIDIIPETSCQTIKIAKHKHAKRDTKGRDKF